MMSTLKVFTLNCWGLPLPLLCKHHQERIAAIGDYLKVQDYDMVVLEEVWVKSDFQELKQKLVRVLPFSHYFYSGTIGSGLCVFSKHQIIETSYHQFHLNGHAHKIHHGDWFGGKGVGLCKIHILEGALDINLYCTHLHAEYNPECDEYEAHRLAQTFELCQFVRNTAYNCDIAILAGDLNTSPTHLGYKILTQHASLKDCWAEKNLSEIECKESGGTCMVPGNIYTGDVAQSSSPFGVRIDYIMYRTSANVSATVADCSIGIGKVPQTNIDYSDHEAVFTSISLTKNPVSQQEVRNSTLTKDLRDVFQQSLNVLDNGLAQCQREERFFQIVVFILSLILYVLNNYLDVSDYSSNILLVFMFSMTKLLVGMAIGFCFWTAWILKRSEYHGLTACKEDLLKLLAL
ncbi:sphingomyelin phosphodiesterase 2-like isoform X2 [Biomphalaria glabrata]|nr:sphingomyelin phosphodiesterase 2-like isoform X2 [Biomphalaria glabrata]XP_055889200.1 sphingomyelin phosphodiesterase 2-like isoform X2 [Biomphalaria glabrata]XP_055889201.1 sphingomyelin phosphodiesterase 2-like isoform X2 [Biomphalaria glabrata]XP_055889202.1 sphingomyelin phosphodiesterase 2-like isoform X2 [Biomphalaria glabrata]XP_055889203.1 sphingomyelin phosphodiesterase 2-like isoform X2 [Biomphalaria glabrata]XP_055889204.1 sphingomyelin phosphodiesterase 2-like isoform X2 [Biom